MLLCNNLRFFLRYNLQRIHKWCQIILRLLPTHIKLHLLNFFLNLKHLLLRSMNATCKISIRVRLKHEMLLVLLLLIQEFKNKLLLVHIFCRILRDHAIPFLFIGEVMPIGLTLLVTHVYKLLVVVFLLCILLLFHEILQVHIIKYAHIWLEGHVLVFCFDWMLYSNWPQIRSLYICFWILLLMILLIYFRLQIAEGYVMACLICMACLRLWT